ncbi:MAG: hypothetical protein ACR2P3_09990, partial [Geminicoccaceae bacterium]
GKAYDNLLPAIIEGRPALSLTYVGPGREAACIRDDWWREAARHLSEIDLYDIDERALQAGKRGFATLDTLPPLTPIRTHRLDITSGLGDACIQIIDHAADDQIFADLDACIMAHEPRRSSIGMQRPIHKTSGLAISEMVLGATGMAVFERLRARLAKVRSSLHPDDLFQLRAGFHSRIAKDHLSWLADLIDPGDVCILATETSVSYGSGEIYPTFDRPLSAMMTDAGFGIHRRFDGIWVDVPSGPERHSHAVSVWHLLREH